MPDLGEIRRGKDLGYSSGVKLIWHACIECGKERWVQVRLVKPLTLKAVLCLPCSKKGERSSLWKGGRPKQGQGYIEIKLSPDDFFYSMVMRNGYVLEHRLVVAKALGRNLHRWEIVHHKNHIRDDNRIENLQLVSDDRHKQLTLLETRIARLEKRVTLLEAENTLLRRENGSGLRQAL